MGSDVNSYVEVSGSLACGRVSSTRLVGEAPASGDKVGLYKVGGHRDDAQKVWVLAVNRLKLGGLPFNTIIGACGGSVTYEMKH